MGHTIYHSHRISIAPMLDWTDRHYRYLARLLTKHARLYTEMLHMGAIVYGNKEQFLEFKEEEHPIAVQLGGSDPQQLAEATRIAYNFGFDEVNLNCGCPSPKVQKGSFGATLMQDVTLVCDCLKSMQDSADIEVTLKHRVGINKEESYEFLRDFVGYIVLNTQCKTFIVHARNAWLNGLSPKENREIPPLKYDYVYQLKKDFPWVNIIINGGINTLGLIQEQLENVDGVMIGREAYQHPMFLQKWDEYFFGSESGIAIGDLIQALYEYTKRELESYPELKLKNIVRHYLGLFHGQPRAKIWRQMLSDTELLSKNCPELILEAYQLMQR
ncbi:MAG: tRNA dihydrouridine(20/20a) synthase DusA [Neisseriaceae bacterium]|nr:MAG: tRNA dihydrouridine(20/20a) synthase DusA [Neisseriaceae bacterium]